jgi:hypothetical protein
MTSPPGKPLTVDAIYRRAGGRRRYNKLRQSDAFWRRIELAGMIRREGYQPGDYAKWAARLGVSRATICRDVRHLWEHGL